MNHTTQDLLTPAQAADVLSVSRPTLATWRHRGQGPAYYQVGKSIRYRRHDLHAWLEAQRCTPDEGRS